MILMNDFKGEPKVLREAMLDAANRVIESGWYVLGKEVETFEKKWASACGVAHGVGVGNGMDAIEIALRTLGIGHGDEVITTPMTAFATVLAIIRSGATPVLADIDPDTALLSPDSAERCISPNTKALLLVHLYGQICRMDAWAELCEKHEISLIEDCAQAHFAQWKNKTAGSFGAIGAYSFYPTKNLGALGDAGMVVTDNREFAEIANRLRNYGQSERYHHPTVGLNSRLDELQAAILGERLRWLPEFTERRQKIAEMYRSGIENTQVRQLRTPEYLGSHVFHLYVIVCKQRESLQRHLHYCQVQSLVHYPIPIHKQESCRSIARDPQGLNHSEYHAMNCLSLPCHPQMTDSDVTKVIDSVNAFEAI